MEILSPPSGSAEVVPVLRAQLPFRREGAASLHMYAVSLGGLLYMRPGLKNEREEREEFPFGNIWR